MLHSRWPASSTTSGLPLRRSMKTRAGCGVIRSASLARPVFGGAGFRVHYENGDDAEYTVVVLDCEVVGGLLAPVDGEALELRYFAPNEAPELHVAYPRSLLDRSRGVTSPPLQNTRTRVVTSTGGSMSWITAQT